MTHCEPLYVCMFSNPLIHTSHENIAVYHGLNSTSLNDSTLYVFSTNSSERFCHAHALRQKANKVQKTTSSDFHNRLALEDFQEGCTSSCMLQKPAIYIYTNKTGDCLSVCLSICSSMGGQTARPNGLKFGG